MKRVLFLILSAALLAGCSKNELDVHGSGTVEASFTASIESFENNNTKTSLSAENTILWSEGDRISVFQGAPVNSQYEVDGSCAGTSDGVFNFINDKGAGSGNSFISVMELPANIAVYPYEAGLTISSGSIDGKDSYLIQNVTIPSEQNYVENSFPNNVFAMVAVTDSPADRLLKFKNVMGALKLQLLGEVKVKSIKIEGNKDEILSGKAQITAFKGGYLPVITMQDNGTKSITLNCGEGVQLSPDKSTSFIIALPPTHFEWGFKVTVTDTDNNVIEMSTNSSNTVLRSNILKMPRRDLVSGYIENFDYITFEDKIVEMLCVAAFDKNDDGKLSYSEAAGVESLNVLKFKGKDIKSFNELEYFTSLKSIDESCFKGCVNLSSIIIPSNVGIIGDEAFRGCSSLSSIIIPRSVIFMGNDVFRDCSSLTSVTMHSGVVEMGDNVFSGCSSLTSANLPESLRFIGDSTFYECSSLKSDITIPAVEYIGKDTFYGCVALTTVVMQEGIKSTGYRTFYRCASLTTVTLPESLTLIDAAAFSGCVLLTNIVIPHNVSEIRDGAFFDCKAIVSVTIPKGVTHLGWGAFFRCEALVSVKLPNSLKSIGMEVFYKCISLKSIDIPENVETIGEYAFESCSSLISIVVPESVTSVAFRAFYDCASLQVCTIKSPELTKYGKEAFDNCTNLEGIYVPSISVETYKTGWSSYADKIKPIQ